MELYKKGISELEKGISVDVNGQGMYPSSKVLMAMRKCTHLPDHQISFSCNKLHELYLFRSGYVYFLGQIHTGVYILQVFKEYNTS